MTNSESRRRRHLGFSPSVSGLEDRFLLSRSPLGAPRPPLIMAERPIPTTNAHREAMTHRWEHAPRRRHAPPIPHARHPIHPVRERPGLSRWSWLENTYWYVPAANLPAVVYGTNSQTILPLSDQTVFHVSGARNGYFWGVSMTQLSSTTPTVSTMIGSVTPEGRVLLNFTVAGDGSTSPTITQGIGQMRWRHGQWMMENQMFTSPGSQLQIGHWAYMVQTRPGLPSWRALPGVGVSVPEFLAPSEGLAPEPLAVA